MDSWGGYEPQVGEIRALRTFRIGPGGGLHPLFSDPPWCDGPNTARCLRAEGPGGPPRGHAAPDPDCTCGFYAYGSEGAAEEQQHARHVLATVACWGHVIAGTRGIRAEQARIEALWLSGAVPEPLVRLVRARYPSVAVYRDRAAMVADHPPTELDCYELSPTERPSRTRLWLWPVAAAAVVLGVLPTRWLGAAGGAGTVWLAAIGFFLVAAMVIGRRRSSGRAAQRDVFVCLAVVMWLVAPFAGPPGLILLRLPLVEVAFLGLVHWARTARAARQFPADIA